MLSALAYPSISFIVLLHVYRVRGALFATPAHSFPCNISASFSFFFGTSRLVPVTEEDR
jgi:hypothetical protein